ncbi:MAG: SGNH/GDSL hydrolase family protein [bacterium]
MGGGRQVAMKGLLLGGSLALSALLLELGVLALVGEQPKFPRHVVGTDFGVRVNEPGARYRHKSADGTFWFEINSRGLRADREYPYEKPAGVFRIVSLGDSFTAGYEVQGHETFSAVLERELGNEGLSVEVLNAGVSGYSNAEAALYLERELLRYDPDLVLFSFYANDLVDNVRTGLFALRDGELVQARERYVPGGALGNFLNTNPVFNWLSGYSNAFVFLKERLTHLAKRGMVAENEANVASADQEGSSEEPSPSRASEGSRRQRLLAAAILDRIYDQTRALGLPLVVQSIPHPSGASDGRLLEMFPLEEFDVEREGVHFLGLVERLEPHLGKEPLYHRRSHGHWTPLSHRISGEALARLMIEEGLIGAGSGTPRARAAD